MLSKIRKGAFYLFLLVFVNGSLIFQCLLYEESEKMNARIEAIETELRTMQARVKAGEHRVVQLLARTPSDRPGFLVLPEIEVNGSVRGFDRVRAVTKYFE